MADILSALTAGSGPPAPGAPPAGPVAGAGSPPGTPPFGSSPLTMPVPNRGNQASGLAAVQNAIRLLEDALPQLAAEPEIGPQLMKAVESLRKLIPEGAVPKGVVDSRMQQFMMAERQNSPVMAALKAAMSGGAGGGAAGGAGGPGGPGGAMPGMPPGPGAPSSAGPAPPMPLPQ